MIVEKDNKAQIMPFMTHLKGRRFDRIEVFQSEIEAYARDQENTMVGFKRAQKYVEEELNSIAKSVKIIRRMGANENVKGS